MVTRALDLAPEQLLHLERKYETNNAKFRKEWLRASAAERAAQAARRARACAQDESVRLDAAERTRLGQGLQSAQDLQRRSLFQDKPRSHKPRVKSPLHPLTCHPGSKPCGPLKRRSLKLQPARKISLRKRKVHWRACEE